MKKIMDTKKMKDIKKQPLSLKERRAKIKKEKLDKKISRLSEEKLKAIDKTMKDVIRLTQKESAECVNGFIDGIKEKDEKKMEKFSKRFISVDRRLHEVIKSDNWTEEKSYETFDMMVESTLKEIMVKMMNVELPEEVINQLKDDVDG